MYVYKITNLINQKVYIGITVKDILFRYKQHLDSTKNYPLYNAFKKYGYENFMIEIVQTCESREEACSLEKYYIKLYNSTDINFGYNQTSGGEDNCGSANPRATLTDEDVLTIRKIHYNTNIRCSTAYKQYESKISFSAFEKIWEGTTWTHIGKEFLKAPIRLEQKANKGEENGNALYSDNEVLEIRKYYASHTLKDTFTKYGSKNKTIDSFRSIIANSYKHLPIYSKVKKCWLLDKKVIDINSYTKPVSTISESGE